MADRDRATPEVMLAFASIGGIFINFLLEEIKARALQIAKSMILSSDH